MSLVTVLRSPSAENTSTCTDSELEEDVEEGSPRSRTSSFEGFFTSKGSAFALPDGDFARKASKHGGEMQLHLQSMVNLLRDEDVLRLVVKLEGSFPDRVRYLTVVSAFNEEDIEESIAMGIDWVNKRGACTIGLVLPLWRDTKIEFDGDGGFSLSTNFRKHILKPVSVQTMWTAVQWIHRCSENARKHNHYPKGLSHQWSSYYFFRISSDQACINEWHEMEDVSSKLFTPPVGTTPEQELMMKLIRHKLKEVMLKVDLEEVTSRMIRLNLEEEMQIDLKEYKQYIDEEMLTILGQMDSASRIYDHVYLGSEWNASNLEELKENGIGYILNISREIDNFFHGTFKYLNIRVYDVEESELLPYWEDSYKFINRAKKKGSKVLVHCKMGISRSASTVIAYGMKEYGTSLSETMSHVRSIRSVANPNSGFWKQLITYEGILNSSKQRYNELFTSAGSRRRTHSVDSDSRKSVKRRDRRRQARSKTVEIGSKIKTEAVLVDEHACTFESGVFNMGDGEYDDEECEDSGDSLPGSSDPTEESLRSWEKTLADSNPSSQSNSRTGSPDINKDEVDDVVGGLGAHSKTRQRDKTLSLQRAQSVPSLVGEASKTIETSDDEALHRCHSLREFLKGKVQEMKRDYKENTLGKHSGQPGSLELTESQNEPMCTSPSDEGPVEDLSEMVNKKTKLRNTLSDPSNLVSKDKIITQSEPLELEEEDAGSVPDQSHVVHRDAHGVVKSGTVKRQSRNFEEGRVNLPWEWEDVLMDLAKDDEKGGNAIEEDLVEHVKTEERGTALDEPPVGVVRLHAQRFQGKLVQERKSSGSEDDEISEGKQDEQELKTIGSPNQNVKEIVIVESSSSDVEVQIKKVNEDMLKEKSERRLSAKRKSQDIITEDENPDITNLGNDAEEIATEESCQDESPLPGTVKKHAQAIEYKYRHTTDVEETSVQRTEGESSPEPITMTMTKQILVIPSRETHDETETETSTEKGPESKDSFDVDVLLRRVNEDMRKEKEQRRAEFGLFQDDGIFTDVNEPETEIMDLLLVKDDETGRDSSEIPRPGIVKRHTELFLGKVTDKKVAEEKDDVTDSGKERVLEVEAEGPPKKVIPNQDEDAVKSNVEVDKSAEKGLVKRHTLVYEGRLPFFAGDEEGEEDALTSNHTETDIEDQLTKPTEGSSDEADRKTEGEYASGTVKRQTLLFEGKGHDEEADVLLTDDACPTLSSAVSDNRDPSQSSPDKAELPQAGDVRECVDTSSYVSVKLRLNFLEDVILGANKRENHKQRTREALAALEDKRKQIECEQKRFESEIEMRNDLRIVSSVDCGETHETKDAQKVVSTDEVQNKEAANGIPQSPPDDGCLNTDETLGVGNVKQKTLLLEKLMHDATDEFPSEPGTSVRRHDSLPKSFRPVNRPVVRQRSLSDINIWSKPSTSKDTGDIISSLDTGIDKNKTSHIEVTEVEDNLPDNDRDSEKYSDDMSEKSDKPDDCNSKPTDIFELGDKEFDLSGAKEITQILDQDNKDVTT